MTLGDRDLGPIEASIVVVVKSGFGSLDETLDAVRRNTGIGHEIIVVANGRTAPNPGETTATHVVSLAETVPFGAAANAGASVAVGRTLCFLDPAVRVQDGWLPPLLAAVAGGKISRNDVALAVPRVVAPTGRLLEAGLVLRRDGTVEAVGSGDADSTLAHRFARQAIGGSSSCTCVRRSSFVGTGGFEPTIDRPAAAAIDLSHRLHRSGLGSTYEPTSCVIRDVPQALVGRPVVGAGTPEGRLLAARWGTSVPAGRAGRASLPMPHHTIAARDASSLDRIAVVVPSVPRGNGPLADRRVIQLLVDLGVLHPQARLTLLALDGHCAKERAANLLSRGVEVAAGPTDWERWFDRRLLLFSHVIFTDLRSTGGLDGHVRRTQPQAQRVLYLPSLDFRDYGSLEPSVTSLLEAAGFHQLTEALSRGLARRAEGFDAIWCASRHDHEWLVGVLPDTPCTVLPTRIRPSRHEGFSARSGFVVLASWGADVVAAHEDAAIHAVRELLPTLTANETGAVLRIVVDEPSPGIQHLRGDNVELVPAGLDPSRWFRSARVCLAAYPYGAGAREAVTLALDTRTPFVTTRAAIRDSDLASLDHIAVAEDTSSATRLASRLYGHQADWEKAHQRLDRLASGARSSAAVRTQLARATAKVGIVPDRRATLEELFAPTPEIDQPAPWPMRVPIVGTATPACAADEALTADEQYRRWLERFGPTPQRLAAITQRLTTLVDPPKISLLMPVFNTEPSWLDDAISSVRGQLYDNWELCIADDGSTLPETLAILEAHQRHEPRIRVVRLPERQGIAAASNAALALTTGEFVAFLDHDDELKPHALAEVVLRLEREPGIDLLYTDEDKRESDGRLVEPFFKPDWSPDQQMSRNYVCHLLVLRRPLLDKLGGFRHGYDGSQDYDLVLRATELTERIAHIPEPLYTSRKGPGSTAPTADAKPWTFDAAKQALHDALDRQGTEGEVLHGLHASTYRVRYAIIGHPKVSIVIPTRDRPGMLRTCVESILDLSTYRNFELLVVDNQSAEPETLGYLASFRGQVLRYPHRFNYARMMNLACAEAEGDLLLLLNNDTEVISPDWIEALLEHAQRPDVGVVGPRLRYPDGRPQHEGIITGYAGGIAGNVDHGGHWSLGDIVRNTSAVTGACMMIRPAVYWAVGGHDERLRVAFNDVDLCLRIRQAGYNVVYTPYAELTHIEGGTRGIHAHVEDNMLFESRWATTDCVDRFYNPNLCRQWPFRVRN